MRSRRAARGVAAAALVVTCLLPVALAAPAHADVDTACSDNDDDAESSAAPGRPFESMRIGDLQDWFTDRGGKKADVAGEGVTVAVLDSGVNPAIPLAEPQIPAGGIVPGWDYFHGTAVAGIIAGPPEGETRIGIAPGAKILDVKIYDGPTSDDGTTVSGLTVATGLQAVIDALPRVPSLKVVNLSVAVEDTAGLSDRVQRLWDAGVIVVASTGNRPTAEDPFLGPDFGTFENGENAAETIYPAGVDLVVGATSTAAGLPDGVDVTDYVLQSTAIDVAVPTSGVLSYSSATGQSCVLRRPATSWAAAEVSGVLAALASAYPKEGPAQLLTRLEVTAAGRQDVRSPLTGAGVLQPYAALTEPLAVDAEGGYDRVEPVQTQQSAEVPVDEVDPLVSTREDMVWFGVVGGGVLVLALVLRPVLARRRTR